MMSKKLFRFFFLLTLCLPACSIIKAPKPMNLVTLRAPEFRTPLCASPIPVQVVVGMPDVVGGLRSDRIALLFDEREIRYLAGTKWEAPTSVLIQRQLVQSLAASACFSGVGAEGSELFSPYYLQTELQRLHLCYHGGQPIPRAEIILRLSIVDTKKGRILEAKTVTFKEKSKGEKTEDLIDALDKVVALAMQDTALWVASMLPAQK